MLTAGGRPPPLGSPSATATYSRGHAGPGPSTSTIIIRSSPMMKVGASSSSSAALQPRGRRLDELVAWLNGVETRAEMDPFEVAVLCHQKVVGLNFKN
jgi:hypothetical protein